MSNAEGRRHSAGNTLRMAWSMLTALYAFDFFCARTPFFDVKGSKIAAYRGQHAENGMIDIRRKLCLHDSCATRPSFNIKGRKTAACYKQHCDRGMVNIHTRRCSHDSCMKQPSFNVEGRKTAAFSTEHAEDNMVDVRRTVRARNASSLLASFGRTAGGEGTAGRTSNILEGLGNNLKTLCKIAGCLQLATGGLSMKQLSHCRDHGPLVGRLDITVQTQSDRSEKAPTRSSFDRAEGGSRWHVKAECSFFFSEQGPDRF